MEPTIKRKRNRSIKNENQAYVKVTGNIISAMVSIIIKRIYRKVNIENKGMKAASF